MDNYEKAAQNAKNLFLSYDQQKIIHKFHLPFDETYLYPTMLGSLHRLNRADGTLQRQEQSTWVSANSFEEVLTLLDLLCDSREDRFLSGSWKSTQNFGHQFHRNLLEDQKDPLAAQFDKDPEGFHRACKALRGRPFSGGDMGYAVELFDGLEIGIRFWFSDMDFPPSLQFFWDENALMYLKYETMHYAIGLLRQALRRCSLQGA